MRVAGRPAGGDSVGAAAGAGGRPWHPTRWPPPHPKKEGGPRGGWSASCPIMPTPIRLAPIRTLRAAPTLHSPLPLPLPTHHPHLSSPSPTPHPAAAAPAGGRTVGGGAPPTAVRGLGRPQAADERGLGGRVMTMMARAGRGGGGRSPSSLNPPPLDSSAGKRAPPSGCAASEGGLASAQVKLDGRRSCAIHPPRRRVFFFFFGGRLQRVGGQAPRRTRRQDERRGCPGGPRAAALANRRPRGRRGRSGGPRGPPCRASFLCVCVLWAHASGRRARPGEWKPGAPVRNQQPVPRHGSPPPHPSLHATASPPPPRLKGPLPPPILPLPLPACTASRTETVCAHPPA